MVVSPRIKSFMRIRSARVVFPLTVGDDEFGEQSAPETVIWTEEIPSQTSETSSRTSPSKGRVAGTGRQRGGGGGGVGREEG